MAILNYIPKKKAKIDHRSEEGGYYEARCSECSETYYPKRKTAKYCSKTCQMQAWRRQRAADELVLNEPEVLIPEMMATKDTLLNAVNKHWKESTLRHKEVVGKGVLTMCEALLSKQRYTHPMLPYIIVATSPDNYAVVRKHNADILESQNAAARAADSIKKSGSIE